MHDFSSTLAIATFSSNVLAPSRTRHPPAGIVAALKVTGEPHDLVFTPHLHLPSSPAHLNRWVDELVADDPMLIGYRLGRISRRLQAAGYRRNLATSFNREGRFDVLDVVRATPTPLSVTAVLHGAMAVDEEALSSICPIGADVAASLALINAVAAWVIYVGRSTPGEIGLSARRRALRQLGDAMVRAPVLDLLIAITTGSID